jgi:hypothetical protein
MAANEASAVGSVRTINTAQVTYASTYPSTGFASSLGYLGGAPANCNTPSATQACIIDNVLAAGTKSGYTVSLTAFATSGINTGFVSAAVPITRGTTGTRSFCGVESGVIYYDVNGGAAQTTEAGCYALPALQ